MLADIAPAFEREYGCTEVEWLRWLPGAVRDHALNLSEPTRDAVVSLETGTLRLDWTPLPPRQIALVRMPRMMVRFLFVDVDAADRRQFMRYFDLYMQRGGG